MKDINGNYPSSLAISDEDIRGAELNIRAISTDKVYIAISDEDIRQSTITPGKYGSHLPKSLGLENTLGTALPLTKGYVGVRDSVAHNVEAIQSPSSSGPSEQSPSVAGSSLSEFIPPKNRVLLAISDEDLR